MTLLALGLAAGLGFRMPFADEWRWLEVVAGRRPVSLAWLAQFDNEHRLLLPKLLYVGLARLTGGDFRAGTFLNVALLSAAAALLLAAIRSVRGRLRLSDGFFPLLALNWAQYDNLIWGFQLHFVLSVCLIVLVLVIVFRLEGPPSLAAALAITVSLIAASLSGAYGVAFIPPLACWLAYSAKKVSGTISAAHRPKKWFLTPFLLAGLAAALMAVVPLWRLGFPGTSGETFPGAAGRSAVGIGSHLAVGLQFLANSLGPAAKETWPVSGLLVAVACVLSAAHLIRVARARPLDRHRALGMLALLAGIVALALVIGWSRAFLGPRAGFETRYVTLLFPLVCLFYLQSQLLAGPLAARIQNGLFALACVLAVFDGFKGLRGAIDAQQPLAALRRDARAGFSDRMLALRHAEDNFILAGTDEFAGWLGILRQRAWEPFDAGPTQPNPSLQIDPLSAVDRAYEPRARLRLTAGQRRCDPFTPAHSGLLWRIDLLLGKWRWRRTVDEFAWQLRQAGDARSAPLAQGRCDYRRSANYRWATLAIDPVRIEAGRRLELVLTVPAEAPAGRYLEIPVYTSSGGPPTGASDRLKGFIHLRLDGGDAR